MADIEVLAAMAAAEADIGPMPSMVRRAWMRLAAHGNTQAAERAMNAMNDKARQPVKDKPMKAMKAMKTKKTVRGKTMKAMKAMKA